MPVCSWCLLDGAHIGETCENLPLYVESRQSKLRERMGQLDGLMEQMDSYGDDLKAQPEQLSGWADEKRAQIAAHFDELRAALDERQELLTQRVAEVEKQLGEDSRDRTTALERTLLSVRELSSTCNQVLEHPNPYVFVEWNKQLHKQMDELAASESVRAVQQGVGAALPAYEISGPSPGEFVEVINLVPAGSGPAAGGQEGLELVPTGSEPEPEAAGGGGAEGGAAASGGASPPTPSVANQYSVSGRASVAGATPAAGAGAAAPQTSLGPRILTVGENMQFPSIGLALEAAGPGDNVVVFEGRYREAITLTKPVEILGVGVLNDIVVECGDARPVLWSWAQYAKVLNITLQQLNKTEVRFLTEIWGNLTDILA